MKSTIALLATPAIIFAISSCGTNDPDYKEWKRQKEAGNQYGAPALQNDYGVPGADGAAPFQPIPGVPDMPADNAVPADPNAPIPATATTHVVVAGDSLWGLSKKYNTTVEAIQAANGLTDTVIRTGQTLNIPGN